MHKSGTSIPVKIGFIGGGSLNWAMSLMADLAYDTRLVADVRLFDIDHAAARRNAEIGSRFAAVSRGAPATYSAVPTLAEAVRGADVLVISILPGSFEDMAKDIDIPARFGIPQAVGDTVGPGGFVRALRAIPMMAEIAEAIKTHAPRAYVCNLTNPMSALTGTLYKVFPQIRAWGECHEVTKIRKQVAWIANRAARSSQVTHRDVETNVLGINHFTFVDAIKLHGRDMMPDYLEFMLDHAADGWPQSESNDPEKTRYFGTRNLVAFDLYWRFGILAAAGDRHLAEFMPARDYLGAPSSWGFALTPVSWRVQDRARKIEKAEALRSGMLEPVAKRSDEEMVDQIAALMGGGSFVSNVNLPNRGQLQGVPDGTIVETNARFDGCGIAPMKAGQLPEKLEGIVQDHAARQTALVDAVLEGEGGALFPLFQSDPLVAPLPKRRARELFDEMILATQSLVPDNLKGAA